MEKVFRVIAWDPVTDSTYNIGLFFAESRDEAIAKAEEEQKLVSASRFASRLVLDAVETEVAS